MLHPILERKLVELTTVANRMGIDGVQFSIPELKGKKHTAYSTGLAVIVSLKDGYAEWVLFRVLDLLAIVGLENSEEGYTSFLKDTEINEVLTKRKNYKTNQEFWKGEIDDHYTKRPKNTTK